MSGSFWKFSNGFTSLSNISTLLENHSINQESGEGTSHKDLLMKLLDENDLLQELLSNNSLLIEFLRQNEVLSVLVDLVVNEGQNLESTLANLSISDKEQNTTEEREEISEKLETDEDSEKNEKEDDEQDTEKHDTESESESEPEDKSDTDREDDSDNDSSNESSEETTEDRNARLATLAAEILSADVWSLTDNVMESTENLNKLWSILDSTNPLSINLLTYFMKIMEHLLDMKCEEMVTYLIDNQPNLVQKFINHLSNPPLMDFLLKLISTDKLDNATGIIDFLQNQNLITYLILALDISNAEEDDDTDILMVQQSSAADFLKALITISANSTTDNSTIGPNELTRELVSYDQMHRLCEIMLKGGYALSNGVGIIIEIIRKNNSDYDILPVLYITLESHPPTGRDSIYLGHLLKVFADKIDDFNKLLVGETQPPRLKTPFGEIEPLGFERFKICELIAELLHCSNMALLNDNKGFDIVKERDLLREKMKEYDPISFKYNEVIVLPEESAESDDVKDEEFNDTVDSFNLKLKDDSSVVQQEDEEEPHANSNLTEEQIRENPVIGDFLKMSLFDTQIITNIISMFFKFPWNNFLHNVVFDIVQQVLNGSMDIGFNKFLAIDLFNRGNITNQIILGQKSCIDHETTNNGLRLGYMGHLTLIAEEVVKFIQLYPVNSISDLIDEKIEDEVWSDYVNNVLYDTREKYNAILGGGEEDEEEDEETTQSFDIDSEGGNEIEEDFFDAYKKSKEPQDRIDEEDEEEYEEDRDEHRVKSSSSDESDDDDDDHFTNYMSQQLTNTASTEISSERSSSDTDNHFIDDDDDDYIDPNDDGLSYKKSHPLYDSEGSLKTSIEDDELSDSSSSSDNDDDVLVDDWQSEPTNKLTRSASKG